VIPERPLIERRILAAFDATPPRIPVLLGGCGSGRTSLLLRLAKLLGDNGSQYLDIERAASTPEGFYESITRESPYTLAPTNGNTQLFNLVVGDARGAFDAIFQFFQSAQAPNDRTPVFLIDELLELRTFESFPGLRGIQREVMQPLVASPNHFVLTTRYTSRAHRLLRDAPDRFEIIHIPPLSPAEVSATLLANGVGRDDNERHDLSRMVHVLADGRPAYVQAIAKALTSMDGASSGDPVSALASQLAVGSHLTLLCRFSYELRLHRARGYGALKAILQVLAQQEPLTLTEISHRLSRTPGSTKDYLTWLQDVDLVSVHHKRYSFTDPVLRLWVRLHCSPSPPDETDLSREVQEYAVSRLPQMELATENRKATGDSEPTEQEEGWRLIEID
jgi:hypothetical protein